MMHVGALVVALVLDTLLGDPYCMPHIIRFIGSLIAGTEKLLRTAFPAGERGERLAGALLVLVVLSVAGGTTALVLRLAKALSPWAAFAVEAFVSYQMIAAKQLRIEALRVRDALASEGLAAGRKAVSMIVGRDTDQLDEAGVIRAAVETVAENASDGVVAPLVYLALGGPVAGVLYKAVNTMDSMVGYKNERYRYFGTAAARLDDVANWFPARLTAVLLCVAAPLVGLDGRNAWKILRRDGKRHASPNAGHPEAACAGAIGVQLAGPTRYFGVLHDKPTIGDDLRPVLLDDIDIACRLLLVVTVLSGALALAVRSGMLVAQGKW